MNPCLDPIAYLDRNPSPLAVVLEEDHDHTMSVSDWAAMLLLLDPAEYQEPPAPLFLTRTRPGTEAKMLVMQKRIGMGLSPYHHDDLRPEHADEVASLGERCRNGARTVVSRDSIVLLTQDGYEADYDQE